VTEAEGIRSPRTLVLATTNVHKAREIEAILAPFGVHVATPKSLPEVEEDGTTFRENAVKKAAVAALLFDRPAIADDSGLVVEALDGEPGVRSARYAGERATDDENNARLLAAIAERGLVDPPAAFVCVAVLVAPGKRVLAEAEGRVEGVVRGPPRGRNGFGYDPLFHYVGPEHPAPGKRFAELRRAEKDAVSHRGRAFRALGEAIRALPPEALRLRGGGPPRRA
jgi:XTP/dITP diphosphohydrolase